MYNVRYVDTHNGYAVYCSIFTTMYNYGTSERNTRPAVYCSNFTTMYNVIIISYW